MRGRPRKPAGMSHRKGHDAPGITLVDREPSAIVVPAPPPGLLKATRDRWEGYWRSSVSSAVDVNADAGIVERWIISLDEWNRIGKIFRKQRIVENAKGQPVLNPLAKVLKQLEAEIGRCELQLGLTPVARLRLGMTIGHARLTAEALNRTLSEPAGRDADAIDAEWEDA